MPGESIRERLSALSRAELIGLVAVLAVTLGGAGLWYVRSLPRPVEVAAGAAPTGASGQVGATAAAPSPVVLLVDVAGWVRNPGVYEFAEGARVIDAIEAAGGARPGALLAALNLAAPLADGTQILVQKQGEDAAIAPGVGGAAPVLGALVNINTASATELDTLPGIGEVLAQRIIDHRTANGPFATVDQIVDVSGIGDSILESIRELITV